MKDLFPLSALQQEAVDQARLLLAEGGLEEVKARVLAKRLNVSVGTIYNLFDQLDDVLFLVGASLYDDLYEVVRQVDPKNSTTTGQLLNIAEAYLDFVAAHQSLWSGILTFNRKKKDHVPDWYREKETALFDVIRHIVAETSPHLSKSQIIFTTHTLWAAVNGIMTVSVGQDGLTAKEEDIKAQITFIIEAIVQKSLG